MPVREIECKTAEEAFRLLLDLAQRDRQEIYFRGVSNAAYTINSTFSRHTKFPYAMMDVLDRMVDHFINSVLSTGKTLPFNRTDRRARLEYARHYGLPSPLIDWSFSPYVSMFFAFNGVDAADGGGSVVYALDVQEFAHLYAKALSTGPSDKVDFDELSEARNNFFPATPFSNGYPSNELFFLRHPASWNVRMTRQMGAFLYDTIDYSRLGASSLEEFVKMAPPTQRQTKGGSVLLALRKIIIPHSEAKSVFKRLELAGITGARLLDDYEGAVADAINAYYFSSDRKIDFWIT